ncbi:hypothetical protein [Psychroserpens sp. SPM9]|uniref:hypothetical protein n=1 Tax=Psychroserpens sp. SPM9 TaxID=2975598 RepID=UPI0021A3FFD3|nr:hypothetical protein [Psychroserpens sp. SPM9]MDG5491526.1 hypothetical protein [Psychroserpens sp. SPM9]
MKLKLTLLVVCLCLFNCKDDKPQNVAFDYKYPSVEKLIDCEGMDTALFQEAVQSFEEDLGNFYTPDKPILSRAYSLFVSQAVSYKVDYRTMVSEHSKKVLEALKQDKNLWTTNPDGSKTNFSHPIFKCIGPKIKDEPLRKTFNALIDTNSMSLRMFGDQLRRKTFGMKDDKNLALYVALDLYYSRIYDMDFSQEVPKTEAKQEEAHDPHAGHNH